MGTCSGRYDDYWWRDVNSWPWREQRRKNREEARQFCSVKGGDLVKVEFEEENTFIQDKFGEDFWLGATDKENEGSWVWTDGTWVDWTNWKSGEPDGKRNANCLRMGSNGQWYDLSCMKERPFVCSVQVRQKPSLIF